MKKTVCLVLRSAIFSKLLGISYFKKECRAFLLKKYGLAFSYGKFIIKHNAFIFRDLEFQSEKRLVHFKINSFSVFFDFFKLFSPAKFKSSLRFRIDELALTIEGTAPQDYIEKTKQQILKKDGDVKNKLYLKYIRVVKRVYTRKLNEIVINNAIISVLDGQLLCKVDANFYGHTAISRCSVVYQNLTNEYDVHLRIDPDNKILKIDFSALKPSYKLPIYVDNMIITLDNTDVEKPYLETRAQNIYFFNHRLSARPLIINNFELDLYGQCTPDLFRITEQTNGSMSGVPFAFNLSQSDSEPNIIRTKLFLEINEEFFSASSPFIVDERLKVSNVSGCLLLKISLVAEMKKPFKHFFDVKLVKNEIIIPRNEVADWSYLNFDFPHKYYKKDKLIRETRVNISDSNSFIPLTLLPQHLKSIIIIAEDPHYFSHKGVDPFFIGVSLAANIAAKKLRKGGSTITMQLARNLFLNNEKNIIRKVEEIVISLLLENYFKISKQRILELYLNIIEFGPDVYGVKEASLFYFEKAPENLGLEESIVISYIIPRPIFFYEALICKSAQLITNLKKYLNDILNLLLEKKMISKEQFFAINYVIEFSKRLGSLNLASDNMINKV